MRRYRVPSRPWAAFCRCQSWADCTINMCGFSFRQGQVRDVFKALYDQGHERWDHSAFLLYLEKMNAPARLGDKANTPPEH